ncbi:M61 family metallopeptidase [Dyella sedimenti]|uniref:M61 family metallopeptidase n=1 Tax=Dyella sedimenti TaxID=2919947 RepID=UPI001FA9EE82|nr:M61 family peptidase [Dyella sedimenti]
MKHAMACSLALLLLALAQPGLSEESPPRDESYPAGDIALHLDLTRVPQRVYEVAETIPVAPGPVSLYYPQWVPGDHKPSNPIESLAGLVIHGNGKVIPWRRDLRNMYLFHLDVPEGVRALQVSMESLIQPESHGFLGATPKLASLNFEQVLLYPAGYAARRIGVLPSITLPTGWNYASALETDHRKGNDVSFKRTDLETLVDSPVLAGEYFKRVDIASGHGQAIRLDVAADRPAGLDAAAGEASILAKVIEQTDALFRARHFDHYDFLLAVSDHVGTHGLEHHQSSSNYLSASAFADPHSLLFGALLPHEYVHSWDGKYRVPADLWTPDFNTPMQDDLLWVYEGFTNYYGEVITARAGIWTPAQYRDVLARHVAQMASQSGRQWRSLQDTADAVPMSPTTWNNWQRGDQDYYDEGILLWFDVDTQIRSLSGGARSLDDFARAFFGHPGGTGNVKTYDFAELVATLNRVQPYDWSAFLQHRLTYVGVGLPETGLDRSGWKLVLTDASSEADKAWGTPGDTRLGPGVMLTSEGRVVDVYKGSPAFTAGLLPGVKLLSVNGIRFSPDQWLDALKTKAPIDLIVQNGDTVGTATLDYREGEKYAHLERVGGTADALSAITAPRPVATAAQAGNP